MKAQDEGNFCYQKIVKALCQIKYGLQQNFIWVTSKQKEIGGTLMIM